MSNIGMIFAHPGHELVALGLIQRLRPRILYLTAANPELGLDREALAADGLRLLGRTDEPTFLRMSESESYGHAFAGDVAFFAGYRDAIVDWLIEHSITKVYGDAQEMYNFHHDLTRAFVNSAVRRLPRRIDNFEIAITCRTSADLQQLRYQEFPVGPYVTYRLTDEEISNKRRVVRHASAHCHLIAESSSLFPVDREVLRRVPSDADCTRRPIGLKCHFDEWGRHQVAQGKYRQPILFDRHFVPIVHGLREPTRSERAA